LWQRPIANESVWGCNAAGKAYFRESSLTGLAATSGNGEPEPTAEGSLRPSYKARHGERRLANAAAAALSHWLPPLPPPPPRPVCGVPRSGCSALLAPAGLFDLVSAPVAAPGPVVGLTVPVDAGPDVAVLGDAPGGEDVVVPDVVAPVWAKAEAAANSAAEVKRASFVMARS
jgi:hypothetical protein